jgi:hypothetical protein
MTKNWRCIFFLLLSAVFISDGSASETDFTQKFMAKEGFTLKLPNNWVQIPLKVLSERSIELHRNKPDKERPVYDYGFQLSSSAQWFTGPYLLIHVNSNGRIPEGKMKRFNKKRPKDESPVREKVSGIPNTQVKDIVYDSNSHTLWMDFVAEAENIKGLIATRLTQKGCIQIICYAKEHDFSEYRRLFEDIVKNIYISKDLEYRARITNSIPIVSQIDFDKAFSRILSGVVVIAVIWLLLNRGKRSSRKTEKK